MTGVPAASASTAAWGKFSNLLGRIAASAARSHSIAAARGSAPFSETRSPMPLFAISRARSSRSGPSPITTSEASGTAPRADIASGRFFASTRRPTNTNVGNRIPSRPRSSSLEVTRSIGGAGLGTTDIRSAGSPQPHAMSAKKRLGMTTREALERVSRRNHLSARTELWVWRPWNSSRVPENTPTERARS